MVGLYVEDCFFFDRVPEGVLWDFESVRVEGRFKGYHPFCEVNDGEGFWVYVRVVLMALSEAGFVDFF